VTSAITVVIPMYNAGAWIRETLESVRAQTYLRDGVELLVLDEARATTVSTSPARSFGNAR